MLARRDVARTHSPRRSRQDRLPPAKRSTSCRPRRSKDSPRASAGSTGHGVRDAGATVHASLADRAGAGRVGGRRGSALAEAGVRHGASEHRGVRRALRSASSSSAACASWASRRSGCSARRRKRWPAAVRALVALETERIGQGRRAHGPRRAARADGRPVGGRDHRAASRRPRPRRTGTAAASRPGSRHCGRPGLTRSPRRRRSHRRH